MQSPEATTSAILGASHNGWSPSRSTRRVMPTNANLGSSSHSNSVEPQLTGTSDASSIAFLESSPSRRQQSGTFGQLRAHSLVSNSPFKAASPSASPLGSPTRRSGITSPAKLGMGSISAAAAAAREQAHAHIAAAAAGAGSSSPSRTNVARSGGSGIASSSSSPRRTSSERSRAHSDAENQLPPSAQPPRKSQGFELLAKSSYVSNSPFRNGGGGIAPSSGSSSPTRPLDTPRNAWAVAAASSSSPARRVEPQTPTEERPVPVDVFGTPERTPQRPILTDALSASPTRRSYADEGATPRPAASHSRSGSASESPSARSGGGLLTSNRLHGPRTMSQGTPGVSDDEVEVRRERRKTVTFDEVLDVQEFDKESSFDVESLRSMESAASLAAASEATATPSTDEEMWCASKAQQRSLVVVNGSPDGSSPAFSAASTDEPQLTDDMYSGCSSSDSRDLSSLDDPPSPRGPPIDDQSFDKTFATAGSGHHLDVDDESFERDGSYADMSGMRRVDSLVDALLSGPILGSPPISQHASNAVPFGQTLLPTADASLPATGLSLHASDDAHVVQDGPLLDPFVLPSTLARQSIEGAVLPSPSFQASIHSHDDSEGEIAEGLGAEPSSAGERRRPLPTLPPVMAPSASMLGDLPALPNWSPLMETDKTLPDVEAPLPAAASVPATPRSPDATRNGSLRGRPHISRDAILSRVAREKKLAAAAQSEPAEEGSAMKHAHSQMSLPKGSSVGAPRQSEPAQRVASTGSDAAVQLSFGRPSMPPPRVTPTELHSEPAPAAIPTTPAMATSPLERLGAEIAAEHAAAAVHDVPPPPPPKEATWFERDESVEMDAASVAGSTLAPPSSADQPASNGRLSPSLLGPAPRPVSPAANADAIIARRRSKLGKPAPRRSQSTGDAMTFAANAAAAKAEAETADAASTQGSAEEHEESSRAAVTHDLQESQKALDASVQKAVEVGFGNGIEREISRIYKQSDQKYKVNDRGAFTGVAGDKVSHSSQAGDVDSGKAWRRLRRPSDMHEYAKEMREYRANENPRKAAGKVFVFIDSFTPAQVLPVPTAPTRFYCILDNGLHVVKTATSALRPQGAGPSKIGQEFELIQHKNLAFSLTLVAQRDAHLIEPVVPVPDSPKKSSPGLARGVRGLFGSPRKARPASPSKPAPQREPLLSFLNAQGAFGRSTVVFEPLTQACLGRCHVVEVPVSGVPDEQHARNGAAPTSVVRGKLRLKLFYLPPMPSVPKDQLPENLTDCIRGMQHAAWHASEPWMEGVLTQLGGDCRSWRRRPVKAQGAHLIGYNEITKKPTIKIDLSKAIAVDESWDPVSKATMDGTPSTLASSRATSQQQDEEELDEVYHVERSFRLTFADGERISFFADTDEQKAAWMSCFSKIIDSDVPPNPMWAQVALEAIKAAQQTPQQAQAQAQGNNKPQRTLSSKQLPAVATVREETPSAMNTPERPQSRIAPASAAPATRVRQGISFAPVTASQTRR